MCARNITTHGTSVMTTPIPHYHVSLNEQTGERMVKRKEPDYESYRPCLAFAPIDIIKRTFAATTQYARNIYRMPFQKHHNARNPALNVARRQEALAGDIVYSDEPAIDDGSTAAVVFFGRSSYVGDAQGIKSDKEFINALEDNVRRRGAPDKLITDSAKVETSQRVKDFLRALVIQDWQSEPYNQQQNFAERRWGNAKRTVNTVMDRTGAPANTWLLCLMWVLFISNHLACKALGWRTPLEALYGVTPDISACTCFFFWEPVYVAADDSKFPSESKEIRGHFVGIAENVGDALTFKVLTDDTKKIIARSNVRSALTPGERNLRLGRLEGETDSKPIKMHIRSSRDGLDGLDQDDSSLPPMATMPEIPLDDIVGRTLLLEPNEDGEILRAKVIKAIESIDSHGHAHPEKIKFLVSCGDDKADEILSYNDIVDHLNRQYPIEQGGETTWRFKKIFAHQGPLRPGDKEYKGSTYNVGTLWEDGSETYEPLTVMGQDCPVACAQYAKENGLLDTPGWKRFRRLAKRDKVLTRMLNQAKLKSFRNSPTYKYGFKVPKTVQQAYEIDKENGNTLWQESIQLERDQLDEYDTWIEKGVSFKPGPEYKRINVHFVFDVKHDGRHKSRLVAGGHMTDVPLDSVYSGVVSLRSLRIVVFLAELNNLELWGADISNTYLEAYTKEKVYFKAPKGFGELEGHVMIIVKALYGLRSSGLRWHEKFADTLRCEGFFPSKADPDVWMRRNGDLYEYIAVYVDDLCLAMKDPKAFVEVLKDIAEDIPEPLGNPVVTTHYVDANLYHDFLTGRAVTGIMHFLNGTLIDSYTKRQLTVETATYGSEFVAARIATEQIIDLRITLRYLGVPIKGQSMMFGDNKSVCTSASVPTSVINKRHTMLSYHRVREAIAAKILSFQWIDGHLNPADILSKHCSFSDFWPHVQVLLFWAGDTRSAPGVKNDGG